MIVANKLDVFSKDTHQGLIIYKNGFIKEIPPLDKETAAYFILENIFRGEEDGL